MSLPTPAMAPAPGLSPTGREIHRNGWLRCIPYLQTSDQLPKSHLENLFVSFCIHDDDGPWLEFYDNRHCSADHKPVARFSLNECIHISPRLVCREEDCFEFAVTLKDKVLRLATESRELTLDWVATLTDKLRERGVFRPKENEYTIEPIKGSVTTPIAPGPASQVDAAPPTRAVPVVNGSVVSGFSAVDRASMGVAIQPVHPRRNMPLPPPPTEEAEPRCGRGRGNGHAENSFRSPSEADMRSSLLNMVEVSSRFQRQESVDSDASSNSSVSSLVDHDLTGAVPLVSAAAPMFVGSRDPTSTLPRPPVEVQPIYEPIFPVTGRRPERAQVCRAESARTAVPRPRPNPHDARANRSKRHSYADGNDSADAETAGAASHPTITATADDNPTSRRRLAVADNRLNQRSQPMPGDSGRPAQNNPFVGLSASERLMVRDTLYSDGGESTVGDSSNTTTATTIAHAASAAAHAAAYSSVTSVTSASTTATSFASGLNCDSATNNGAFADEGFSSLPPTAGPGPPEIPARSRHSIAETRPLSPKPPRAVLRREATQDAIFRVRPAAANPDGRPWAVGMDILNNNNGSNNTSNNSNVDPNGQSLLVGGAMHDRQNIRNSTVVPSPSPMELVSSPTHADAPQINESLYAEIGESTTGMVPLREAQILKLQEEMAHQAGTLVRFAKRELQGSLALVDVGGAVYIAGWNKPQMKNHLHVGDRLLNICGRRVICASEAHKTIKSLVINQTVELTIQRMPYGRALAMRKSFNGENLGLIMEGGTNEVHRVLEGGLVHSSGLPLMVPTALDGGMTLTSWWITEVNHRPINLFFKNSEIEPRLRAVGKDISLVVQPSDFIRALKKQLKSMWTYKSYIVQ